MLNIINLDINKLIPYINNPRNNENAIDKVVSSIKEFGFKVPIIDARRGYVYGAIYDKDNNQIEKKLNGVYFNKNNSKIISDEWWKL